MRFAVKSAGGITDAFLHADDVDEAVKDAAKQIVSRTTSCRCTSNSGPPRLRAASLPDAPSFASLP